MWSAAEGVPVYMNHVRVVVVLIVAVVELGAAFGGASATATQLGPDMLEVELVVAVVAAADAPVLAHLVLPGEPESIHPMLDQGDGIWSTVVEVRRADWKVVFEAVTSGDLSERVSLTALGVDPGLLTDQVARPPLAPSPPPTIPWGRLALGAGASGLALLLYLYASGSVTPRHLRWRPRSRRSGSSSVAGAHRRR